MHKVFPIFLMLAMLCSANAANLSREARIAEQVVETIMEDPVWLVAENQRFLAIHTPATTQKILGGVILLHGMGANPDWTDVIHPLRTTLPERGWETLSIQLPVARSGAPAKDYLLLIPESWPRIQAAIGYFLAERNNSNLILIGHSLGARMGLEFLSKVSTKDIEALALIGLPTPLSNLNNPVIEALEQLNLPILDIYGSRDLDAVLTTAERRKIASVKANNQTYRQQRIEGADHFFRGLDEALVSQIDGWLKKTAAGREIKALDASIP